VLVHGAWHGGWCWARVGALASAAGIDVRAVTLTGLGDPAHLICPEVDLRTHAEDVVAVVEAEELDRIVVVAHSFAGVLLGEVTERLGGRLRRLARPSLAAASFGITDAAHREWVDRRLTDHPHGSLVGASGAAPPTGLPRAYIACTERQRDTYVRFAEGSSSEPPPSSLPLAGRGS
jgi:pimeloyl-ACP methyl ester carboxylesterase